MKALPKKLLPLILFGIAVTSLFSVRPAQGFTVTLEQVGPNVVANGSGAINLTGLTFVGVIGGQAAIVANSALIAMGPLNPGLIDYYGDPPGRRVSGAGACSFPTVAAEILSPLRMLECSCRCQRDICPVLLYRMA